MDEACNDSHLRIEQDFGGGFVKLRASEAEKRQAAQDIRSSEDVLIELLRNSRDAHAKNIFVATHTQDAIRTLVLIDDGDGIPEDMQLRIFEPRVTSKLDTAHMDKWGIHGRGMALYSVNVNSEQAKVVASDSEKGASILVRLNIESLGEKKDQSTFPHFEIVDSVLSMRGPKNILRILAEFSLEHKEINVYCGSPAEITSTIYYLTESEISTSEKAFRSHIKESKLYMRLGYADNAIELESFARSMGLIISERTARRILDGQILPVETILSRIEKESFPQKNLVKDFKIKKSQHQKIKFSKSDLSEFARVIDLEFKDLSEKYLIEGVLPAEIKVKRDGLHITIPFDFS